MIESFRAAMAGLCYWAGDATYRLGLDHHAQASAYQTLMRWSDWWQGDSTRGPWRPVN